MKYLLFLVVVFISISLNAQYFYKDIVGTQETNNLISLYRSHKVQGVAITGYDADGTRSEDFFGQQLFLSNKLKTITRSGVTDESQLTSDFDDKSRIVKTEDTTASMISTTIYAYDVAGRLVSTRSNSKDSGQSINETEEHKWFYNTTGKPERMLKIINSSDTTEIKFIVDNAGNVTVEQTYKKGVLGEKVYYYYDDKNRMTDIVRFNKRAGRLLPDYMFEYSPSNQVIQKITVPANSSDYLIWRYQYNDKGLKVKEACYTREKQLTGKIEYVYSFGS